VFEEECRTVRILTMPLFHRCCKIPHSWYLYLSLRVLSLGVRSIYGTNKKAVRALFRQCVGDGADEQIAAGSQPLSENHTYCQLHQGVIGVR
jgi:hypothetical protein